MEEREKREKSHWTKINQKEFAFDHQKDLIHIIWNKKILENK